jgi:hypothetical protein
LNEKTIPKTKHVTATRGMGNLVWTASIRRKLLQANVAVGIRRNYEHNPPKSNNEKNGEKGVGCEADGAGGPENLEISVQGI